MDRWVLLHDSGCARCGRVARLAADYAGECLEVGSLADEDLRAELSLPPANAVATWEPLLVRVRDRHTRTYRGVPLRLRLTRLVGLTGSLELMRAARSGDPRPESLTRRTVLTRALTAAGVVFGLDQLPGFTVSAIGKTPAVQRLRGDQLISAQTSEIARTATKHFGQIDWQTAVEGQNRANGVEGYVTKIGEASFLLVIHQTPKRNGAAGVFTLIENDGNRELQVFTVKGERIPSPGHDVSAPSAPHSCGPPIPCLYHSPIKYLACVAACVLAHCKTGIIDCAKGVSGACVAAEECILNCGLQDPCAALIL